MTKNKTELSDIIYEVLTDLSDYADDAIQDERDDAYAAGYKQGRFDQRMDTSMDEIKQIVDGDTSLKTARDFLEESRRGPHPTESELTPQERRDEIVEQAKEDIRILSTTYRPMVDGYDVSFWPKECELDGFIHGHNVEFVVNSEKRTVVCLIRFEDNGRINYRGIAKCAPDDCFNAHIGKVIALSRALRLEVPDEYIYTPQPTEVRVGDVVVTTDEVYPQWGNGVVESINSPREEPRGYYAKDGSFAYLFEAKIVDDTREGR